MSELVCIECPNGCVMEVSGEGEALQVGGNKCPRGKQFAISEATCPMRTISSTVRTVFEDCPVVPVRVSGAIPKNKIFDVMKEINKVRLDKACPRGYKVIENVLDLGVDVIVTSNVLIRR